MICSNYPEIHDSTSNLLTLVDHQQALLTTSGKLIANLLSELSKSNETNKKLIDAYDKTYVKMIKNMIKYEKLVDDLKDNLGEGK